MRLPPVLRTFLVLAAVAVAAAALDALVMGRVVPALAVQPYFLHVIVLAGINVMMAVSLNLISGFTGQFSLGHAGFMAIGAYGAGWVAVEQGERVRAALSFAPPAVAEAGLLAVGLTVGAVLAAIGGLVVGVPSLRLRGDYLAIVTLGFGEIIRVFILNIDQIGGARGYSVPKLAGFGWVWFFAVATVLLVRNLVHSSFGRTLIAVREDEIAAESMGVNTTRAKVLSFVISAMLAGVGGGLFGYYSMYLHTNSFSFIKSIEFIIMIVIGGLGSTLGAVVGAALYIGMTEGLREFGQYRMVIFSLLLILVMIFRPQGLFGHRDFAFRRKPGKGDVQPPAGA